MRVDQVKQTQLQLIAIHVRLAEWGNGSTTF